jgi:putative oxidoreductase
MEVLMDVVLLIGRILFGMIFVMSGISVHFKRESVEFARAYRAPAPELLVPLSGVAIIAGGLSVILGVWADLGALVLIAFLIPIAFIMHAFWRESDEQMQQIQMAQFLKNISMAGGALIVFWLYNQSQDLPLSITDALFSPW